MFKNMAEKVAGGAVMVCKKSVVEGQAQPGVEFLGTATLCHAKGYFLTSAHSITLADKLCIVGPQPVNQFNPSTLTQVQIVDVVIAQFDAKNDVALLKSPPSVGAVVPENMFATEDAVKTGSSVMYVGYPFGHMGLHTQKVSASIISAKVISPAGTKQFQFDAMVHEGNSGGPLVDLATGQLIGIVVGRFSPSGPGGGGIRIGNHPLGTESTISFAVSISHGLELLRAEGIHG